MSHERRIVFRIAQQSRNITHENKAARFKRDRGLGRSDVSVAIVNLPALVTSGRADHRRNIAMNTFLQWLGLHPQNFANESQIAPFVFREKFATPENIRSGKAARFPTE